MAHRSQYRNASETPAVLGVSPWVTPYQLWLQRTGRAQAAVNPAMLRGRELEPLAREAYEQLTGARHGATGAGRRRVLGQPGRHDAGRGPGARDQVPSEGQGLGAVAAGAVWASCPSTPSGRSSISSWSRARLAHVYVFDGRARRFCWSSGRSRSDGRRFAGAGMRSCSSSRWTHRRR